MEDGCEEGGGQTFFDDELKGQVKNGRMDSWEVWAASLAARLNLFFW